MQRSFDKSSPLLMEIDNEAFLTFSNSNFVF